MNTDGRCGQANNVLDQRAPEECAASTILYANDFEGSLLGLAVANSAPPTPYNWVLTTAPLPYDRPGKAAWCESRNVGNCNSVNESGTHSMTTTTIVVPSAAAHPYLAFTHTLGSEGLFDGGRVEIAIDGSAFAPIPRTAFNYNPYNARLTSAAAGNTDPLASSDAWTGLGGQWGRSIIDLAAVGAVGRDIRIRFTFGKDGCTGGQGWYVDDLVVYDCPDCDTDTRADILQYRYRASTAFGESIGFNSNVTLSLAGLPQAADAVEIQFLAKADLSAATEYVVVSANGIALGDVFRVGGSDCAATPSRASLLVPAAVFNSAIALGNNGDTADFLLVGTAEMNAAACTVPFIGIDIRYNVAGPADADGDFTPDSCELCPADFNQSGGAPTVQDIFDFLSAYFANLPSADFNTVGGITVQDIFDFLTAYFTACP